MIHTQLCRLTLDPSTLDGSMRTLDPLDVTTGDHRLDYSRPPSTPSTLDPRRGSSLIGSRFLSLYSYSIGLVGVSEAM